MKATYWLASACLVAVAAGCRDNTLAVDNVNSPDITRVFAVPSSIESAIGSGYQTAHNAVINTNDLPSLITIDNEQYSALNNFQMGPRGGIPRNPIQNQRGGSLIFNNFKALALGARLQTNAIDALDKLRKAGGTTGSASPLTPTNYANSATDSAQDMRDRSFGLFIAGMDMAWMAMQFDSAAIVIPGIGPDTIPPLSDRYVVMTAALAQMDSAYAYASKLWGNTAATSPDGKNYATSLAIPLSWTQTAAMNLGTPTSGFPLFIRSWEAYFMANVARTPKDRADISQGGIVDWTKVVNYAENFPIAADFTPLGSSATAYSRGYSTQGGGYVDATWGMVNPFFYGMADTSGAYSTQISLPPPARGYFLITTPDLRFPQGPDRPTQRTNSPTAARKGATYNTLPYIDNRPSTAQDSPGDAWGVSYYDNYRLQYIPQNSSTGVYPDLMVVTLNLLAAEGHFRLPGLAGGVAKGLSEIDISRARAGLPKLSTGAIVAAAVPTSPPGLASKVATSGGPVPQQTVGSTNSCIPRVPYGDLAASNGTNSTACGDAWEALKYEYRMESEYTGFAMWFFYNRGFNDLIDGSANEWPVPAEEMDARYGLAGVHFYNLGGNTGGGQSSNTGNTYHNFRMF